MSNLPPRPSYRPAFSGQPRLPVPPGQLLVRAPVFAVFGACTGTWFTGRAWADCPLGNDADAGFTLTFGTTMDVAACMTVILLLSTLSLWALSLPVPVLRCLKWPALVAIVVGLTVLYRVGMQSPVIHPDGSCTEGFPLFPFQPKQEWGSPSG